jgi:hypothetical protein
VHPQQLAVVSMADHCTRNIHGGSPISKEEPIIGLLFGSYTNSTLEISDAEDVPFQSIMSKDANASHTSLSLHQAVYIHNVVVGWYRVVLETEDASASPTPDDLLLSQRLVQHYCPSPTATEEPSLPHTPFIFALLHVKPKKQNAKKSMASFSMMKQESDDGPLPVSLYLLDVHHQVFMGVDHVHTKQENASISHSWTLTTSNPERIAVERVMRSTYHEPPTLAVSSNSTTATTNGATKPFAISPFILATQPIQESLFAIHERVLLVEQTLVQIMKTNPTTFSTFSLLRQVQGLLLHVSMMASFAASSHPQHDNMDHAICENRSNSDGTTALLQQLATLSKTVTTVQEYTEKICTVRQYEAAKIAKNAPTMSAHSSSTSSLLQQRPYAT